MVIKQRQRGASLGSLVHLNKARRELALLTRIDEIKEIRDKAEALRMYSKQAGESLEMQNNCVEIKIRAERRAGELLKESGRKKGETNRKIMCHDGILSPTLKKLGIEPKQSMRWQIIAGIPERVFEEHVESTRAKAGADLTNTPRPARSKRRRIASYAATPSMLDSLCLGQMTRCACRAQKVRVGRSAENRIRDRLMRPSERARVDFVYSLSIIGQMRRSMVPLKAGLLRHLVHCLSPTSMPRVP